MPPPETPSDVRNDSVRSEPGGAAAPPVIIQHGLRNEAIISRPIHGQVTQVGRENIINICTETKTFQFKISSKQKDVEAVVAINMMPDEDLDPTKTLVLGQDTTPGEITAGGGLIFRIECDERHTGPRNGYTVSCDLRSKTRRILRSLFEGVNMFVNYIRRGSIIIGLQPQTDRAVFTLLNAMEGDFIEELVRGIIENEPDWNIDDDSGQPIKMKIDINIPQGMFPKEFPCKKFASRKELLQELTVSLMRKEREEREKGSPFSMTKTSRSEMSMHELVKQLVDRSEEELSTRMNTVNTIRSVAKEVKNIHNASDVAVKVSSVLGVAGLVLAPFTAGLSLAATAGFAGIGMLASAIDSTQRIVRKNKAQEQFIKYDSVLVHLLESITLLMDRTDKEKEDVKKLLEEVVTGTPINRGNSTLRVMLHDIHGFQLQKTFMVPFKGKLVALKDLEVMDYITIFFRRREDVSDLTKSLERLAKDLEAYEVVTSPLVRSTMV